MPAWSHPVPAPAVHRAARPPADPDWIAWRASAGLAAIEYDDEDRFRLRVRGSTVAQLEGDSLNPGLDDVAAVRERGGRVLVATVEGLRVVLREGRRVRTLGPAKGRGRVIAAAAPNGRAVVAWSTYDRGIEIGTALRVYVAVREPGARHFGRARLLDRARVLGCSFGHLRLALNARAAVLSWSVPGHRHRRPVRVARAGAHGGFGAPVRLGNAYLAAVALRADGTALAAWAQDYGAVAALARPGHPFGAPEHISDGDRAHNVRAAFTAAGRARVEWGTHRPPQARYSAVRTTR